MTAVLSAISFVLAFFEFPVPLSPSFARMDLSDLPALIGAFAYGPISGILIELVKNALQFLTSSTGGIGELANFIMGSSFVVTAGLIYKLHKTKRTALIACLVASVVMGITAAIVNYFILLPVFEAFMPLDQLIASFGEFMPFIKTKLDVVLFNAFPFDLMKGIESSIVTMLLYKQLTPILKGRQNRRFLMQTKNYLQYIVEKIHPTVFATVDRQGHPVTCAIDMMDYDESGLYFLTEKGKNFYDRLKSNENIARTAMKGEDTLSCVAVSVQGKAKEIGPDILPELFCKNPNIEKIYS